MTDQPWPVSDQRSRALLLLLARLVLAVLLAGVLTKALAPGGGPPAGFLDKLQHSFAFYVLALGAAAAAPRAPLIVMAAGLAAFGGMIEFLQAMPLVDRTCDFDDWIADLVGVALAYVPLALVRWRRTAQA